MISEPQVLFPEPSLKSLSFRHVFMRSYPATARDRMVSYLDQLTVGECMYYLSRFVRRDHCEPFANKLIRRRAEIKTSLDAVLENVAQVCSRVRLSGSQPVNAQIRFVADDKSVLAVKYAKSLGQACKRHFETLALGVQFTITILQSFALELSFAGDLVLFSSIANCVNIDTIRLDANMLEGDFDGNCMATRQAKYRTPLLNSFAAGRWF